MSDTKGSEKALRAEWDGLFDRLIAHGRALEKAEMAERLGFSAASAPHHGPIAKPVNGHANTQSGGGEKEFGLISGALRYAFDKYGRNAGSLTVPDIIRRAREAPSAAGLTDRQLRTALKGLVKGDEVRRVRRGRYRPTEKLQVSAGSG